MFIKGTLSAIFLLNICLFTAFTLSKNISLPLFIINLSSIFILWIYLLQKTISKKFLINRRVDIVLAIFIFLVTLIGGFTKIDSVTPGMWGDEVTVASTGEKILSDWGSVPFVNVATGYTKPYLFIEGFFVRTFGRNIPAIRTLSVVSGAVTAVGLYIFLRLLFGRLSSFIAANLFIFSYPFLVVLRLAYNITAAMFFEVISFAFLYLYFSRKNNLYLLGLGLSLGCGLYTYVGFRIFALTLFTFIIAAISVNRDALKAKATKIILLIISLFTAANAFLSFNLTEPTVAMARIKSLSVFGQGLPTNEVLREVGGATIRLIYIFIPHGDPSARSNPSGVGMFDPLTSALIIGGLIFIFKHSKKSFLISLLFILPFIANDIFSLERIPEFHYYGIGHPNTYRLFGMFPIFYYWLTWSFETLFEKNRNFRKLTIYMGTAIAVVIILVNINRYFNQESINKTFYRYNYIYNGVASIKAAKIIKDSKSSEVRLSESLTADPRIRYFSGNNVKLIAFDPKNDQEILSLVRSNELTIIDVRNYLALSSKIASAWEADPTLFYMRIEKNPFNEPDLLILSKVGD